MASLKDTSCLVTGGAGFIGSHLVERLVKEGARVAVLDNLSSGFRRNLDPAQAAAGGRSGALTFVEGTITDRALVERLVTGAELVFHLAARPSVAKSVEAPAESHEANIQGTFTVLEVCRLAKPRPRRIVNTSSSSVYGNTPTLPKSEEMAGHVLSPYALQKWTGEAYARLYHELYRLPTVSIRPFNVFGPRQDPSSHYSAAIARFVSAAIAGQPLTIYGDGEQTRDFTPVANIVDAFLAAATTTNPAARGQAYNGGAGGRTSINRLAELVLKLAGSRSVVNRAPARPGDIRDSYADLRKIGADLGYRPKVDFETGLRELIEWERARGG